MDTNETPTNPYAVMTGMPGYMPNRCDHYACLSDALEAVADELDRAEQRVWDIASGPDDTAASDAAGAYAGMAELVRGAIRNGFDADGETYAQGFWFDIDGFEVLSIVPISPEDFDADTDC